MKTKLLIAGIALAGIGAMHMGKVRVCPLGMIIHGMHKNSAAKPTPKPIDSKTATVTTAGIQVK